MFNNYRSRYREYNNAKMQNPNDFENYLGIAKGTTIDDYCMTNLGASIRIKKDRNSSIGKNLAKLLLLK